MQPTLKESWMSYLKSTLHFLFTFGAAVGLVLVPGTSPTFDLAMRLLGLFATAYAASASQVSVELRELSTIAITAAFAAEVIFAMWPFTFGPMRETPGLCSKLLLAVAADVVAFCLVLAWGSRHEETTGRQCRIKAILGHVGGITSIGSNSRDNKISESADDQTGLRKQLIV
ncbi:hypothetical protein MIND_00548400 [Mycena indigotica]|uniref:Uncharacterized protein n=1 Tax=Mycena indigotica TaxID=2126181 RepID=A0A8H6SY24_9AGAR|nr:uncharacterized protein MIND_00548400 [Mycena indigotica]KAF7307536.1 hypothetical protein MIND_00548400 [Mycena indigotica]